MNPVSHAFPAKAGTSTKPSGTDPRLRGEYNQGVKGETVK